MASIPEVTVEMGLAPGMVDVSAYVDLTAGLEVKKGRSNEFEETGPATCSFRLDNRDGRFTPDNADSPFHPNVIENVPVRVKVRSEPTPQNPTGLVHEIFTGRVDSWSIEYENGMNAVANVQATDFSKLWGNRILPTTWALHLRGQSNADTRAWEFNGSLAGLNSLPGNPFPDQAAFRASRQGSTPSYGSFTFNDEAPPLLRGSVQLTRPGNDTGGIEGGTLLLPVTANPGVGSSMHGWFRTADTSFIYVCGYFDPSSANRVYVRKGTNGKLEWGAFANGNSATGVIEGNYHDDGWHHVALTVSTNGRTIGVYVDGRRVVTHTVATALTMPSPRVALGAWPQPDGITNLASGDMSFAGWAVHPGVELSSGVITELLRSVEDGWPGEPASTRFGRLAGYGINLISLAQAAPMAALDTGGKSQLALAQELAAVSGGHLDNWPGSFSWVQLTGRRDRYHAPRASFDAELDCQGSIQFSRAETNYANTVAVSNGTSTGYARNDAEITRVAGEVSDNVTILMSDPADLAIEARYRVGVRSQPRTRVPQVVIDGLAAGTPEIQERALRCVPGSRITVTGLPASAPRPEIDLYVESCQTAISDSTFTVTLDTSPGETIPLLRLDDPDHGRLAFLTDYGMFVNGATTAAATSISFFAYPDMLPSSPSEYPIDLRIDEERIRVTAPPDSGSLTAPVVRGVSGGRSAHALAHFAHVDLWVDPLIAS